MLECREVLENLGCYIDGEGSAELRRAIELHIARCRCCRVVAETTGRTLQIISDAAPFEVPLAASARLYERLRALFAES
jgi:anti-sigma factor RsiW